MDKLYNIFKNIKFSRDGEIEEKIYEDEGIKVLRTLSLDQVTDFYDQDELEIVFLLKGKAQIEYEDGSRLDLREGDSLVIRPHEVHRVSWQERAVWLCIFKK
ncbi:nif11 domain/cupin domain protein [Peptoniphilus harei]|uniref:cupin domain-containing protein n=1 Tax=Peptoniphilus harei TaxID=54005 RepID=UPI000F6CE99F|nr:cupin domain-containing protein [Peptoniphilus harei]QQE46311.1 cupin domain-containing protein [Peptoniphilus harei]VEJ33528.1 nif11 domain/cupin domain protein [Peptoniphilus harei]